MAKTIRPPISPLSNIDKAMQRFVHVQQDGDHGEPINFAAYLEQVTDNPTSAIRNIFQTFHDLIEEHVVKGPDGIPTTRTRLILTTMTPADCLLKILTTPFSPIAYSPIVW